MGMPPLNNSVSWVLQCAHVAKIGNTPIGPGVNKPGAWVRDERHGLSDNTMGDLSYQRKAVPVLWLKITQEFRAIQRPCPLSAASTSSASKGNIALVFFSHRSPV